MGLREFLLADGGGLVEGRLVLRDLGPEVLDLRVQPCRPGTVLRESNAFTESENLRLMSSEMALAWPILQYSNL